MGKARKSMANDDIVGQFDQEKDDNLKIRLQKPQGAADCLILSLTGYIDTYNSTLFQRRVQKAIDAGFQRLIFQCEGLNYVSSTGIGAFTGFLKTVKPKGGDVALAEVQPKVLEVFQLLGFSQFFKVTDTLEEALAFFSKASSGGGAGQGGPGRVFPKVFECPVCHKKLKAEKPGKYRCSECKSVAAIDEKGQVTLG
jgi:anti-anti-sigma factor